MTEMALERLKRAVGDEAAHRYAQEAMAEAGLREITTPDELLAFANRLVQKGGLLEAVGHALKVSAILRGARKQ
jgi:hypothetical protein